MASFLRLLLVMLMLAGCARAPRTPRAGQRSDRAQTRSSSVPAVTTPTTIGPAPSGPHCTIALELPGILLDCTFDECPESLVTALLTADELAVERGADGALGIVQHRTTPPLARHLATLTPATQGWELTDDEHLTVAGCSGLPPEGSEARIKGVSVRRNMPGEAVQARP